MIIKQEISDKELEDYSSKVIDLLHNLNITEKYKVINALHNSLLDIIKSDGGAVVEVKHD
jgi:hypothetical protein